jgi:hypothetical protein
MAPVRTPDVVGNLCGMERLNVSTEFFATDNYVEKDQSLQISQQAVTIAQPRSEKCKSGHHISRSQNRTDT